MQSHTPPTAELLARARQGDAEALNTLLERYRSGLRAQLERECRDQGVKDIEASDVAQDVLVYVAEKIGQFRGSTEEEFLAWLQSILDHQLKGRIRHAGAQKRDWRRRVSLDCEPPGGQPRAEMLSDGQSSPSQRVIRREQLAEALETVPSQTREVLRLYYFEDLAFEAISQRLGLTMEETVLRYDRGLRALRKHLPIVRLEA